MVYRVVFILIVFLNFQGAISQTKISFEDDCLRENSVLLARFLIESRGEDYVSELLEKNNSFLLFCDVDSLGKIKDIVKIREKKELSNSLKNEIVSSLLSSNITFFICYQKPMGVSKCEAYELLSKDLFNEKKTTYLINISFPGDLMSLYQYEKLKKKKNGITLTKLQYLIDIINKNYGRFKK